MNALAEQGETEMTSGKEKAPGRTRTSRGVGLAEPGFAEFAKYYRRLHGATTAEEEAAYEVTIGHYAEYIGMVRRLSPKPLLKLDVDELEALDDRLQKRAACLRTALKMFYKANKMAARGKGPVGVNAGLLLDALPRRNRPARRKAGMDEVLTPGDVMRLVASTGSKRDRALLATLYGTGGRIGEVVSLRVRDLKPSNGSAWQAWFGTTKVRGQERHSAKVSGEFKRLLDEWLAVHPARGDRGAWLFPSTEAEGRPLHHSTVSELLKGLARKAGLQKRANPHWFRHSRISVAFANAEADAATLNTYFWGSSVSMMSKRYSHFQGLDAKVPDAEPVALPDVPALPVSPMAATVDQVKDLTARLEENERRTARLLEDVLRKVIKAQGRELEAGVLKEALRDAKKAA